MASLSLRRVCKLRDGRPTLSDVELEVADGEFVVILGPSGCGKSTLLRMIAGLETVSSGQIAIDGRVVNDLPGRERDVAMVFQNYALYPHMTVRDNLGFGLRMRGCPRAEVEAKVQEVAEALELVPLLARRPRELSGGQQQRVALGRAILRQPKLFLFDEPLSNLDARLRAAMRAELIRLHRRLRATMIYVTHDQVEALSLAQRILVLKDGLVQQVGAPLEIYDQPANRFVAGFLGSPPMNFIDCRMVEESGALRLEADGLRVALDRERQAALRARAGSAMSVVLGVRPEDFRDSEDASGDAQARVRIEFLEALGSEVVAYGTLGGGQVTIRLAARTRLRPDDDVAFGMSAERLRFFDPLSGERWA